MRQPQPRLQRLLRALLACWMLLAVFEPPLAASASGQLRTLSAWLSPAGARPAAAPLAQVASRAGLGSAGAAAASPAASRWGRSATTRLAVALAVRAGAVPGVDETALPCGNGRYLYLEIQSLLC